MTSTAQTNGDTACKILIGVCSARKNKALREGIRRTWLSRPKQGIEVLFFVGDGTERLDEEPDTLALPAADTYEGLPGKVQAFFTEALRISDFDWLFKCDDDTYVELERLPELISDDWDLVGNEFVKERGSPSGGAGYLLRRNMVEALANLYDSKSERLPHTPLRVCLNDAL